MAVACVPLKEEVRPGSSPADVGYWARVLESNDEQKSAMLLEAESVQDRWKIAMLRSVPGTLYVGAKTARGRLQNLLDSGLSEVREMLTLQRLVNLEQLDRCESDVASLRASVNSLKHQTREMRDQVEEIIDIEKELDDAN